MNATEMKAGEHAIVSMMTQEHANTEIGEEVVIVGFPIVTCKMKDGSIQRFYCHEYDQNETSLRPCADLKCEILSKI